jgi:hypothetical protein
VALAIPLAVLGLALPSVASATSTAGPLRIVVGYATRATARTRALGATAASAPEAPIRTEVVTPPRG